MHTRDHGTDDPGQPAEVVLFDQAQTGGRESLNALMERHDGLVHAVVRRQVLGELPYADALQAGRIGLWRAIMRFDPHHGYAFSTYAWTSIVHHVWRAVKAHTCGSAIKPSVPGREGCSAWLRVAGIDPETIEMAWTVYDTLHALVATLPPRLREVVVARYGLGGSQTSLYREMGEQLGLSGERVRQLHREALVWLRHPPHSHVLRSLLGQHRMVDYEWAETEAQDWLRQRRGRHGRS